jgi:hypothetical protein
MWLTAVAVAVALVYFAYRASLSFRSAKARRAGDSERADALSVKGSLLFLGVASALVLVTLVGVVVVIATS